MIEHLDHSSDHMHTFFLARGSKTKAPKVPPAKKSVAQPKPAGGAARQGNAAGRGAGGGNFVSKGFGGRGASGGSANGGAVVDGGVDPKVGGPQIVQGGARIFLVPVNNCPSVRSMEFADFLLFRMFSKVCTDDFL